MLFRRNATASGKAGRTDDAGSGAAPADDDAAQGKGRPTPTRKEAEAARKARVTAQAEKRRRGGGGRADRDEVRAERVRMRAALMSGDERSLPARDRGPVRRLARDYVDARRTVGEFMLPAMILFIPMTLAVGSISNTAVRAYVVLATYAFMLTVIGGTTWLAFRVKRMATQRFPDTDVRGIGFYAAMRSLQLRRWRLPRPQVRPGAEV